MLRHPRRRSGGRSDDDTLNGTGSRVRETRLPAVAVALAGEVAARAPALPDPRAALDHLRGAHRGGVRGDSRHRPLSPRALRLQRRRAPLGVAGPLLHLRGARHRSLSAVHPRGRARLSGEARHRLSRTAVARSRARQVVAGHPALPRGGAVRRRWALVPVGRAGRSRLGRRRIGRPARVHRGGRAAVHGELPEADLRLRPRHGPLGGPGGRLRRPDDGPVSAVPARPGR